MLKRISVIFYAACIITGMLLYPRTCQSAAIEELTSREQKTYESMKIVPATHACRLSGKVVELVARDVTERSSCIVAQSADAQYVLALDTDANVGSEGFRIERGRDGARIVGGDERGLLYGAGRFLRDCRYTSTGIIPGSWTGVSKPQLPVRGIYFATHFHNFYHDAPVDEVVRYVEDLSLWGCNTLMVWFDMHHYQGIEDPGAAPMIERLRTILLAANSVGMGIGILFLANEGYSSTPASVRVTPGPMQYNCEVCPSKPGGMELIVKNRRELLERFADVNVEYFCIWPHDQGGCGCQQCNPWGARGFVECIRSLNPTLKTMFPHARTIVSTWCFDRGINGEFQGLWDAIDKEPSLADFIMADAHDKFPPFVLEHGKPAGVPIINFPEISMIGMLPWGGYGANPLPQHIDRIWQSSHHLLSGGFPYSEGIYEDLNKAVMFQLYWKPGRQIRDIIREYAAYEWSWEHSDALTNVAMRLGEGAQWDLKKEIGADLFGQRPAPVVEGEPLPRDIQCYSIPSFDASQENLLVAKLAASTLTPYARQSWRWRILYLRVALEDELRRSNGKPTYQSDKYFEELTSIYHAQKAEPCLAPPTSRFLTGLMANAKRRR